MNKADIVNGYSGISPEMAIRLDKAFGGRAEMWIGFRPPTILPATCNMPTRSRSNRFNLRRECAQKGRIAHVAVD